MLTEYTVHCPEHDCGWRGRLLPLGRLDTMHGGVPHLPVRFCCPRCRGVWEAVIDHDDPVNLRPAEEAELQPA